MTGKETDPNPTEATVVFGSLLFLYLLVLLRPEQYGAAGAGGAVFSDTVNLM